MRRHDHPKRSRLLRRNEFRRVVAAGRLHAGGQCIVRMLPTDRGRARLGLATPRGYGKAVRRNRFRRLVREAFRLMQHDLGSVDVLVAPRRHLVEPTLDGIRRDLQDARPGVRARPR